MPDINIINGLVSLVNEFKPHLSQESLQVKEAEESWKKIKEYWDSKKFATFIEAYTCFAGTCIQEHPEQVLFTPFVTAFTVLTSSKLSVTLTVCWKD